MKKGQKKIQGENMSEKAKMFDIKNWNCVWHRTRTANVNTHIDERRQLDTSYTIQPQQNQQHNQGSKNKTAFYSKTYFVKLVQLVQLTLYGRRPHFFLSNGRQPQYFVKCKTTSIFWQVEDNINFLKIEYDLNILANGKRPQQFGK